VVSALEFLNADLTGRVDKFSEEYLIWGGAPDCEARRPAGRCRGQRRRGCRRGVYPFGSSRRPPNLRHPAAVHDANTFGSKINAIENPPPAIVTERGTTSGFFVHRLPGRGFRGS